MQPRRKPRICIASLRAINPLAAWCSLYEIEDVTASIDDVDLLTLRPGPSFRYADWITQRMMWRPGLRQLARNQNPGLLNVDLNDEYDLLFVVCMNMHDLLYLNAVRGWRERCKTAVCFVLEMYAGMVDRYSFHLSTLRQFDHVCVSFAGSVEATSRAVGKQCHHLPVGVDVLRFTPFPRWPRRSIDVYCIGRRAEWLHETMIRESKLEDTFYVHDTIPSAQIRPRNYLEHRDLFANIAKRSRCFVTFPAKIGVGDETLGQSEVGSRYFEGAAAGCALIGEAPESVSFRRDFDWPDSVIPVSDEAGLIRLLHEVRHEPERVEMIGRRNGIQALRRHDWSHRWREVLEWSGLKLTPAHLSRQRWLEELASGADTDTL